MNSAGHYFFAGTNSLPQSLKAIPHMKKLLLVTAVLTALYFGVYRTSAFRQIAGPSDEVAESTSSTTTVELLDAVRGQHSGRQVTGEGVVSKILSDDNEGSRHQRFILTLSTGQTLLIAHNVDLAPRIASLKIGDTVGFYGVYEWNPQGGVIHWTHRDPEGRHESGWLKYAGQTYR